MIRETKETKILVEFTKKTEINTQDKILDHMLETLLFYMNKKAMVKAEKWDLRHHLWEDTGITIGEELHKKTDRKKIKRFGNAIMPMDDALVLISTDISRTYVSVEISWDESEQGFEKSLIKEFLSGLARALHMTLHIKTLSGKNAHHVTEAIFKGLGVALGQSLEKTEETISTKGTI